MNEFEQTLAIRTIAGVLLEKMQKDEAVTYLAKFDLVFDLESFEPLDVLYRSALGSASSITLGRILKQLSIELPNIEPTLPKNWMGGEQVKAFISHVSADKVLASKLAVSLSPHGFNCFVAHSDIEPTSEWQIEIQRALDTMDVFISINKDGFDQSVWCQQEVGYAYARRKKIVPVKFGVDPSGFVSKIQALDRGTKNSVDVALEIVGLLKFDDATRHLFPEYDPDDNIPF